MAKAAKEGDAGKGMEGVQVTARILPENEKVYELLVTASRAKGWSQEEVNTSLINAGLVAWVDRISTSIEGFGAGADPTATAPRRAGTPPDRSPRDEGDGAEGGA